MKHFIVDPVRPAARGPEPVVVIDPMRDDRSLVDQLQGQGSQSPFDLIGHRAWGAGRWGRARSFGAVPAVAAGMAPMIGFSPPGVGQLSTLLGWVTWGVGLLLIAGFTIALGKTGMGALRHGHYEGSSAATVCLVCAVVLGAVGTIFQVFGISAA